MAPEPAERAPKTTRSGLVVWYLLDWTNSAFPTVTVAFETSMRSDRDRSDFVGG